MGKRKSPVCLYITAVVVTLGLIVLLLGLTLFKPKHPITTVDSISLPNLDFKINLPKIRAHINLTLSADINVRNPNRSGFKYAKTSAFLKYRGNDVGYSPIPAGVIGGRGSRRLNLTLTLMEDRLLSNADFHSDAISGTLSLQTEVWIPGRVRTLFGRAKVVAHAACDLEIHLVSRSLVHQTCYYKKNL